MLCLRYCFKMIQPFDTAVVRNISRRQNIKLYACLKEQWTIIYWRSSWKKAIRISGYLLPELSTKLIFSVEQPRNTRFANRCAVLIDFLCFSKEIDSLRLLCY